jgi:hypothetical protein
VAKLYQQPQQAGTSNIDWANPITRGLSLVVNNNFAIDCISRLPLTKTIVSGNITAAVTSVGQGLSFSGASQVSLSNNIFGNGDVTALFFGNPTASASIKEAIAQSNGSNKVWFGANTDENEGSVSGQLCLGLLQSGVNRSSVKSAGAIDGSMSTYLVGKSAGSGIAYKNGQKLTVVTTGTLAGSPTTASDVVRIGGTTANSGLSFGATAVLMLVWKRKLSDLEAKSITLNPWQIFCLPASRNWIPSAGGGAINTPVNPDVGTISISGYAPTVTRTAHTSISPAVGSISLVGYAPEVQQLAGSIISPGAGTINITGYAPAITKTANLEIVPGVGGLVLTGYAPTVNQAAGSQNITPIAGAISIIGYPPNVVIASPSNIDYDKLALAIVQNPKFLALLEMLLN